MKDRWDLSFLYSGFDDPKFKQDMSAIDEIAVRMNALTKELPNLKERDALNQIITLLEELQTRKESLGTYCFFVQSCDTLNEACSSYLGQLDHKISNLKKSEVVFQKYIAEIKDLNEVIYGDERLLGYRYFLNQIQKASKYMLSDEVEEVIAKLDITGGSAWSQLQQFLTSTVTAEYEGKEVTLSEIRNKAYDKDASIRKAAYEAELKCYDKIKDSVAFSLNNIKGQVITVSHLRGFESPLAQTLFDAQMKQETLDALLAAMKSYLPKFRAYMKCKGALLGHKNGLPFYDLFAPVGEYNRVFTIEDARDYLVSNFAKFAPDLAEMVKTAFAEEWIDFYPRSGKVGGAFCCNIQSKKTSRVLTNFEGSLSDVVTLAHELGHAYHNNNIHSHQILNQDYSMPVAETASTFNENVIMNVAIQEASGTERLALIESQLQDLNQIIIDIYSRYLFESKVFAAKEESFLSADRLCQMMLDAQKEAYGDGLDPDYLHPYMWVCKSHYYSSGVSFYNFPYAFGGLFARGLYAQYVKEGEAFLPKYRKLLHETTISSVEETAAYAGIDLTDQKFWEQALETAADQIDEFIRLSEKLV